MSFSFYKMARREVNILSLVSFASRQAVFGLTCPDGQVKILEKIMAIKGNASACVIIWAG